MLNKKRILSIILLTMLLSATGIGLAVQNHHQGSQVASIDSKQGSAVTQQEASISSSGSTGGQSAKVAASSQKTTAPTVVKVNSAANTKPTAVKRTAVPTKTVIKKAASTTTAANKKTTSSATSNQTTSTTTPSRGGQRTLTLLATAYDPGPESNDQWAGISYLGTPLHYGIVAVDPDVIPLGSHLYIEGYGEGYAADTGGAIKGNRIDLCYDTYEEAMNFGMKYVKVTILD